MHKKLDCSGLWLWVFRLTFFVLFDLSVRAPGKYHTTIYPYIHQTCNNRTSADQVRSVVIPDVDPTDVPPDLNFSMAAGDFLEVYTEEGTVSCLVKCRFIRNFPCLACLDNFPHQGKESHWRTQHNLEALWQKANLAMHAWTSKAHDS